MIKKKHKIISKGNLMQVLLFPCEILLTPVLLVISFIAGQKKKRVDIGLGPLPLINNVYHKKVFLRLGYTAETFVNQVWHITQDFDVRADQYPLSRLPMIGSYVASIQLFILSLFRYRAVVIYFDGSVFGTSKTSILWRLEPCFFALANVKTLILPYGIDVQVLSRSPNLLFKDAMSKDYPLHKNNHGRIAQKIDLWTKYGDHVVGGCEWVDYMYHWDTLMISHFSIDTDQWRDDVITPRENNSNFRVLHAPNHRNVKGTDHIINAIQELQSEGYPFELVIAEKRPNHEIRNLIRSADVVIDQLVIGWYAMLAIEGMALEKPVICNLRKDLQYLYRSAKLYAQDEEIPLIHACPLTIKSVLIDLYERRSELAHIGKAGNEYVRRHHSIEAISNVFGKIAEELIGSSSNNGIDHDKK